MATSRNRQDGRHSIVVRTLLDELPTEGSHVAKLCTSASACNLDSSSSRVKSNLIFLLFLCSSAGFTVSHRAGGGFSCGVWTRDGCWLAELDRCARL